MITGHTCTSEASRGNHVTRPGKILKSPILFRLAVGAAVGIGASLWLSDPDSQMTGWEIPKAIAVGALVALTGIRMWYALRVTATIKKRYAQRDRLPQALAQLGVLVPLLWVVSPVLDFANYTSNVGMPVVGTLCYATGLWLCYRSHADLGQGLSATLDLKAGHSLITEGIYRRIRHPMYLGFLVFTLGQALVVPNFVAGLSGVTGILLLVALRVDREEQMMLDEFGDEYAAYSARTSRLLPGIW